MRKLRKNIYLREVGALPEDTSCEGCGVGTLDICRAGSWQLGHLGGDQKNVCTLKQACLLAAPGTPHFGSAYAEPLMVSFNFRVFKIVSFM